jgi:hypothetical protein
MKRIWIDWVYSFSCIPAFFYLLWGAAKSNRSHRHWQNNLPWWKGWPAAAFDIGWKGICGLWWAARHPIECSIGFLEQYDEDSVFYAYEEKDGSYASLFVYTPFHHSYSGELCPNYYTVVWTPYGCLPFPWFAGWIGYSREADERVASRA